MDHFSFTVRHGREARKNLAPLIGGCCFAEGHHLDLAVKTISATFKCCGLPKAFFNSNCTGYL
jgi:hypothetical protein